MKTAAKKDSSVLLLHPEDIFCDSAGSEQIILLHNSRVGVGPVSPLLFVDTRIQSAFAAIIQDWILHREFSDLFLRNINFVFFNPGRCNPPKNPRH